MNDAFGRAVDYLRISVTEACNLRCMYCAPNGHPIATPSPLSVDEIARIVRAAAALGITRIRLTGGEPLLRRDIVEIVRATAAIDGVRDLAMTTNGIRLAELARPLADAGLCRVNISLDSLQREKFARIVGVRAITPALESSSHTERHRSKNVRAEVFDAVWAGIHAAEEAGLAPLKLNCVMMRDVNDNEVEDFAQLTIKHEWHVRFIELMPVGSGDRPREFFARHFVPAREIVARLPDLAATDPPRSNGPARTYRLPNARATIGFITPASEHFCNTCNRVRVTARGALCACLFGDRGMDLRGVLCKGVSEAALEELLARAIRAKPERHPFGVDFRIDARAMSEIGG